MRLTFLGAAHEVTGSCYYLEAGGKHILIDCGMEQGRDMFENQEIPVQASDIDMVLLTHAHIDHSGKLPLLAKQGFDGQIFSTEGTKLLCDIMLLDSAHIQEFEVEWKNRKAERAGKPMVEPLYTTEDAQNALKCFVTIPYETETYIADGVRIRFVDAGHLLGSSSIEIKISENGIEKTIVFSGDIGNTDQPIIKDPQYLKEADYVVMESTYGNRSHERPTDYTSALADVLQRTFDRGGNVVIPSFAVGRTQEMLYFIREIKQKGLVSGHDGFEVWIDSPLAVEATEVFMKRMYADFDDDAKALLDEGVNPISFAGLRTSVTSDESKAINANQEPKVIISASGMCEAGRIRHHLKHNLWRPESTILFVGYQAEGTLGRSLVEGADKVKLFGEDISVEAEILVLPGISGHADDHGLMKWIGAFEKKPSKVFICHGEADVADFFRDKVHEELGLDAYAPYSGTIFDLATGELVYEAPPVPIFDEEKEKSAESAGRGAEQDRGKDSEEYRKERDRRGEEEEDRDTQGKSQMAKTFRLPPDSSKAYRELFEAGCEVMDAIRANARHSKSDLRKFASELRKVISRWR
ncbi:MAG: MBL fold metallo-hydrolase [Lachnospiraceae bacterium]|nr:MBL fold metallo-hydrolase [Lachnospiraceae bacterium]